jgi:hypothetical protein
MESVTQTVRIRGGFRAAAPWLLLLIALLGGIWLAGRDRGTRPVAPARVVTARTIRLPAPPELPRLPELPPAPAEMREAAADLERSAEQARNAAADLERVKQELEEQRRSLETVKQDADANATRTRRELEDARERLEAQRAELERAGQAAEQRVAAARADLERLQEQQLEGAAAAGIANGLSRSRDRRMAVLPDPRRGRNPAVAPFVPNEAAVAAAAAAGRPPPGAGMQIEAAPGSTVVVAGGGPGQEALDYSAAAINRQTAAAMALDNRIRTAETFFEARRINRINRAFEAGPGVTMDQAVRIAAMGTPGRPSELELDPQTGAIGWPRILADPLYDGLTDRIDSAFRERARHGGSLSHAVGAEIEQAIDRLADRLRSNVTRHPAGRYGAAQNFLDRLRAESLRPISD